MINNFLFLLCFLFFGCCFAECEKFETQKIPALTNNEVFSFYIIDAKSENVEGIIQEILALQSTLLVDNQATSELPSLFAENGFLTMRMNTDHMIQNLLDGGKIITARCKDQLVGYLIISELGNYFPWLREANKVEIDFQSCINELEQYYLDNKIKILNQIAVATPYAKQGIGRELVQIAKELAPHGLSTDILYKPFTNQASFVFFSKQNFIHIGTVYVLGKPPKCIPHEICIQLWRP